MQKKLISYGFLFALGEAIYVSLVALLMSNANRIFGNKPGAIGFITFLLLFVLSAAISGALILGKPILLYLDGKKKEALEIFSLTLGWMFLLLVALLIVVSAMS